MRSTSWVERVNTRTRGASRGSETLTWTDEAWSEGAYLRRCRGR
jgi:hypothetical protein